MNGSTIYGYDSVELVKSNVVKDLLEVIQSDIGHAVSCSTYRKETTVGENDDLFYNGLNMVGGYSGWN
jgi:hypothetical protein